MKALIIYGARRVGKTTLLHHYLKLTPFKYKLDSGDNLLTQTKLDSANFESIKEYVAGYDLIVIDEAQKIKHIGQCLKIMTDQIPGLRIIATGSSSFELAGQIGEPLTGRKKTLTLFPIAQLELQQTYNSFELKQRLEEFLIYGSYPETLSAKTPALKREYLTELAHSYLLKDILELDKVKIQKHY